jgi:MFS family permease
VRLPRLTADLSPLRASRDLRLLLLGEFVTGLGTQAALVAVPYQMYTETHSPFLTGLLGAVELGPLIGAGLVSGALADRVDRRRLLLGVQVALVLTASTLAAASFAGHPPSRR